MDICGIEITNQLRSAIRAKLLELGIRYDEELPDYILVMVVNKKTQQQMNEDLNLFLEDSTEPFVNWLHDQVLKKLQKVTITKKKSIKKAIIPIEMKKEIHEGQKIVKAEDESKSSLHSILDIEKKFERDKEFEELVGDLSVLSKEDNIPDRKLFKVKEDNSLKKNKFKKYKTSGNKGNKSEDSTILDCSIHLDNRNMFKSSMIKSPSPPNQTKAEFSKISQTEVSLEKTEKTSDSFIHMHQNLKRKFNSDYISSDRDPFGIKQLRLFNESDNTEVSKITASINKPKITSVVTVKTKLDIISSIKKSELYARSTSDKNQINENDSKSKITNSICQKNNFSEIRIVEEKKSYSDASRTKKSGEVTTHSNSSSKDYESSRIKDLKNKDTLTRNLRTLKSCSGSGRTHKQNTLSFKSMNLTKVSKPRISNVKSRLGLRSKVKNRDTTDIMTRIAQIGQSDVNFSKEDDDGKSVAMISFKSHLTTVKKSRRSNKRNELVSKKKGDSENDNIQETQNKGEIRDTDDVCKVSSKVIVTPRPLKPLQLSQRRATQSLLLRAVAEANQSVVMQKKVDPCLKVIGNNYSYADKKYQLYPKCDQECNEYILDINKLEMSVNMNYESQFLKNKDSLENSSRQQCCSRKKRKLSPIVYERSRSNSPSCPALSSTVTSDLNIVRRPSLSSVITTVSDKSSKPCRYWPKCTIGMKCTYYHPEVLCCAFPKCKFGKKCSYVHPQCKFGSSCTKFACKFSHPPVQCKYHPYCLKPRCQFSHLQKSVSSLIDSPLTPDLSEIRAKFTWKKKD